MVKGLLLFFAVLLITPAASKAVWWVENDYALGSKSFQYESLSAFARLSPALMSGANASFYKDHDHDLKKAYVFRAPLMYSASRLALSLQPFVYPASSGTGSSARGAKFLFMFPLSEAQDENYLHVTLSGAAARQKTPLLAPSGAPGSETFSETAFEAQVEKSFYNQFFFQASAAGFAKTGTSRNSNPTLKPGPDGINPVMDHGELAHTGTFRKVTALPKWAAAVQFARNMAPDYDSYIYAGFSRIAFRNTSDANSILGGLKLKLTDRSTLDLAYNFYKINGRTGENYYKLLIQVFFPGRETAR